MRPTLRGAPRQPGRRCSAASCRPDGLVGRRRRRPHQRARRVGGRQRHQPARAGHHRRRRRLRRRDRHQHRARARRHRRRPGNPRRGGLTLTSPPKGPSHDPDTTAPARPAPPSRHQLALMIWLCVFPTLTAAQRDPQRLAGAHVHHPAHLRAGHDRRADRHLRTDAAPAPRTRAAACKRALDRHVGGGLPPAGSDLSGLARLRPPRLACDSESTRNGIVSDLAGPARVFVDRARVAVSSRSRLRARRRGLRAPELRHLPGDPQGGDPAWGRRRQVSGGLLVLVMIRPVLVCQAACRQPEEPETQCRMKPRSSSSVPGSPA